MEAGIQAHAGAGQMVKPILCQAREGLEIGKVQCAGQPGLQAGLRSLTRAKCAQVTCRLMVERTW